MFSEVFMYLPRMASDCPNAETSSVGSDSQSVASLVAGHKYGLSLRIHSHHCGLFYWRKLLLSGRNLLNNSYLACADFWRKMVYFIFLIVDPSTREIKAGTQNRDLKGGPVW